MTRKEEIEQKLNEVIRSTPIPELSAYSFMKGFNLAAEWADKTMIDKVCKWLKGNLSYSSKPPYQLIEDLRKAMEQ